VLVHGWPLCGATYRGLVHALAPELTCFVVDLRGAGDSPWDPNIRNVLEDGGDLVVRFADAVGLDRFALVGHDSGGTMARVAAAALGDRVTALALSNTDLPNHVPTLVRLYQTLGALPGAAAVFRKLLGFDWYRQSGLGFGGCFGDRALIEGDFREACVEPLLRNMVGALLALKSVDFVTADRLPEIHARITAPTVFVWGDRDPFFPIERARRMPSQFRDPRGFHAIEGAKLLVHEEAPERVAAKILPLLRATAPLAHAPIAASE
jgi:pimeloyl-ACP methyl ester carboxylesterase